MAGGAFAVDGPASALYGKITVAVVITCIVAASSGLIFGYDIGISGGVTTMVPFLSKFFPSVLKKKEEAKTNLYCMYDSQVLTAFTSSLYIAGLVASLGASRLTALLGRRNIMILGGCTFLVGAAINGGAANIAMLILGRILLGFGVGFTNQATPVYLSEVAPPRWRGAFNTGFQFFIGIGVVAANCINYGMAKHSRGWRVSLGLAMVPAAFMTIGALLISDTPSSLVERGKLAQAKKSLQKVRGSKTDVEPELNDLIKTSEITKSINQEPFVTIFQRQYRPHLVMAIAIPFFQQLTGINIIAFYAPILFQSVGFGSDSALIGAIILGVVNLCSILVSTFVVDRFGRRFLFLLGGIQMFVCQVGVACLLAVTTGVSGTKNISKGYAILVLVLMCIYAAGFGWSWGPLSWLIPSEIFPLKIRSQGQSISVAVNFATTFVLSQTFLTMLCHFKYGTFLFYAGWILVMTLFVAILLPETKGIPLDSMHVVWERHWFWRWFVQLQTEPPRVNEHFASTLN
ncbi:sugar transport protein 5 [Ziziphus jujuba]|uniref:Sugar transport protein 5 n=1 Tax=Ziziphus jujuba TaxID=326968 RepID=A0ABM3IP90_ZIZJJ|nr:sugar transport protein 5 [Ziziphus jujuba]XP_048332574.2 sugar transport protein 5 [Ziziphus jujuba]XP_048332575.2 sugar transport protein 5 [Ziziphus jujuba]XP_048332576.2 sugar transport protein 5 [Ziziphus jujuba]XP_048332577.2 sugar transport protein 5 [Ziziphus jujuba]XP_048332578.2 sugar transport protein 5 [Ziziphus jujuba]